MPLPPRSNSPQDSLPPFLRAMVAGQGSAVGAGPGPAAQSPRQVETSGSPPGAGTAGGGPEQVLALIEQLVAAAQAGDPSAIQMLQMLQEMLSGGQGAGDPMMGMG